jgi:hypothetical protein
MIQEIITLSLVFFAATYSVYSLIRSLTNTENGYCNKSCSCGAKTDIRNALKKHKVKSGNFKAL